MQDTPFQMFQTYATRGVFEKCDGVNYPATATVIGHEPDHLGRLNLIVEYSNGMQLPVTAKGTSGLGYPHATDLVLP